MESSHHHQEEEQQQQEHRDGTLLPSATAAATSAPATAASITKLSNHVVRRLVSGCAVSDLASCVKELVDNALDAGAATINVRLFGGGVDIVEVSDDGAGVPVDSRPYLAVPHATSKLRSISQVYNASPQTLGFRGEALFSLVSTSKQVVIATRTSDDALATKLTFKRDGQLDADNSRTTFPRKIGTTVAVLNFLERLPVRRKDMISRLHNERSKLVQLMEQYAVFAGIGRQIRLMDIVGKNCYRESVVLSTTIHSTSLRDTISTVLGPSTLQSLCDVTVDLTGIYNNSTAGEQQEDDNIESCDSDDDDDDKNNNMPRYRIYGMVSEANRSSNAATKTTTKGGGGQHRQYFCVNGRPAVEIPPLQKVVNSVWKSFLSPQQQQGRATKNNTKKPSFYLNLVLPRTSYDVNLRPDKRQILLVHEQQICRCLQQQLSQLWSSQTDGTFSVDQGRATAVGIRGDGKATATTTAAAEGGSGISDEADAERRQQQENDVDGDDDDDDDENVNYEPPAEDDNNDDGLDSNNNNNDNSNNITEGQTSPSRFNRRYAFSHDMKKARLQHEYDDGRQVVQHHHHAYTQQDQDDDDNSSRNNTDVGDEQSGSAAVATTGRTDERSDAATAKSPQTQQQQQVTMLDVNDSSSHNSHGVEEKKNDPTSADADTLTRLHSSTGASANKHEEGGGGEGRPSFSKRRRVCLQFSVYDDDDDEEEDNINNITDDNNGQAALSSREAAEHQSRRGELADESERRRWRTMQETFNNASGSSGIEEDMQRTTVAVQNQQSPSTASSNASATTTQQFGLERFGFGFVATPAATATKVSFARPPPSRSTDTAPLTKEGKEILPGSSASAKQQQKPPVLATENGSSRRRRPRDSTEGNSIIARGTGKNISNNQEDGEAAKEEEKGRCVDDNERSGYGDDDDDNAASVVTASNSDNSPPITETTTEPTVTWDSFTGTKDVILAERKERLAMRSRKRKLQGLAAAATNENEGASEDNLLLPNDSSSSSQQQEGDNNTTIRLSKDDFENMHVIGQFNMGFILASTPDNNIWILDQHACDEKYNFEKLCKETVIHEQRLLAPMPLEMSPAEETCVLDYMDLFEKNGFRFNVDLDKPPRHRLALTALPHSKAVQFGKEDVAALCAILGVDESSSSYDGVSGSGTGADGSGMYGNNAVRRYAGSTTATTASTTSQDTAQKVLVRLPKAVAMFASRACRSSIMIGKGLSPIEMDRIVKRLKSVDNPWNCPHGRPTMRHVANLHSHLQSDEQKARVRIAAPTATVLTQETLDSEN